MNISRRIISCILTVAISGMVMLPKAYAIPQQQGLSPDYTREDSIKVMTLFKKASSVKSKSIGQYMIFFARQFKGIPYVAKTLENNRNERLVVNLRQLDCTTYVETVLALSRCMMQGKATFDNYCTQLRFIRYADGKVSYPTRKHYFTYWIQQSAKQGLVKDIQGPNPPFKSVQTVTANYMSNHLSQYPMLNGRQDWVKEILAMEKTITGMTPHYIPKASLGDSRLLRQTVKDGDIIALVTTKDGLELSHVGVAVWHKDGLHMLHASSRYHKVVEDSNLLKTYLSKRKTEKGIRIVRPVVAQRVANGTTL